MNTEINDIVISDKQEHLRIITEDIVIQSNKLAHILEERDGLICDINDKKKELEFIESQCGNIYSNVINLQSIKEKLQISIQEKEDEFSKLVKDIEDKKYILNNTINALSKEVEVIKNTIDSMNESKLSFLKELNSLKEKIESDTTYFSSKQKAIMQLKCEFEEIKKDKEKFEQSYTLEKKEKLNELNSLEVDLANALEIIKNPMQALNSRESQLDKRERNFNVLVARFQKEFKKLHPDLNPVI